MTDQAHKSYEDSLAKISEILEYEDDMKKSFSEEGTRRIRQVLNVITDQLEKVYRNEKIEPTVEEKSWVRETVDLFVNIAIEKPITPIFRDLSSTYLLLVFNWNEMLGKRSDISRDINLVNMIIEEQLTILDTIRVLQRLLPKIKTIEQYGPPAFDLSRAYLNSLKKEIGGQKPKPKKMKSKKSKSKNEKSKSKKLKSKKRQKSKK